eukprot:PLAT582.1.p1 GENE.PLAT582.1~~PLAT582.1.p1  ORF type:complete len:773 (+),score=469.88 PLAT582.1:245-2320(+)
MRTVSSLLLDGPISPMHQALIDSGLGSDYSAHTGFSSHTRTATFSVGLEGIRPGSGDSVLSAIDATLARVAETGFPQARVDAVLHQTELALRAVTTNTGLGLLQTLASSWTYGGDLLAPLRINQLVADFKTALAEGPLLQQRVAALLQDDRRVTLEMYPDSDFLATQDAEEAAQLAAEEAKLDDAARAALKEESEALKRWQASQQDDSCLPTMAVEDLPRRVERPAVQLSPPAVLPSMLVPFATRGITYSSIACDALQLTAEQRQQLPLLAALLPEMGAADLDARAFSLQSELATGGIAASLQLCGTPRDERALRLSLLLGSHALQRNSERMLQLMADVLLQPRLDDREQLRTQLRMMASNMSQALPSRGHVYARALAASQLTPAAALSHELEGLPHVLRMNALAAELEGDAADDALSRTIAQLTDAADALRAGGNPRVLFVSDDVDHARDTLLPCLSSALGYPDADSDDSGAGTLPLRSALPTSAEQAAVSSSSSSSGGKRQYWEMALPVHFVAQSFPTVPIAHADCAALQVCAQALSSGPLHSSIRESGGAYGSGASQSGGVMTFWSYYDPNTVATMAAFQSAIDLAAAAQLSEEDIAQAKLRALSDNGAPQPPSAAGSAHFLHGRDAEDVAAYRDALFAVTADDVVRVARTYLQDGSDASSAAMLGPPGSSKDVLDSLPGWTVRSEGE